MEGEGAEAVGVIDGNAAIHRLDGAGDGTYAWRPPGLAPKTPDNWLLVNTTCI